MLTVAEVRNVLNTYVASQNLSHPADPRYFQPDAELLRPALLKKGDRLETSAGHMGRVEAADRLMEGMQRWYTLEREKQEPVTRCG